jgi:hypothetical protein
MPETTTIPNDAETDELVEAPWDTAECTCPDWCERDHERD